MSTKPETETFPASVGKKEVSEVGVTSVSLPILDLPQTLTPAPGVADGCASATGAPGVGIRWQDISATSSVGIVSGELYCCIMADLRKSGRFRLWGYFGNRWNKGTETFENVAAAKSHLENFLTALLSSGKGAK